jgi:hypothetical protein
MDRWFNSLIGAKHSNSRKRKKKMAQAVVFKNKQNSYTLRLEADSGLAIATYFFNTRNEAIAKAIDFNYTPEMIVEVNA